MTFLVFLVFLFRELILWLIEVLVVVGDVRKRKSAAV